MWLSTGPDPNTPRIAAMRPRASQGVVWEIRLLRGACDLKRFTGPATRDDLRLTRPLGTGYNPTMTDDELQGVAENIDELEGALQEWDIRGDAATVQLPWLHDIIVELMEASAQTTDGDQDTRVKLAALEHRTRRCRSAILRRNGLTN